ncbi:MAG: response regulator transcription factor [Actinobacteria bacterium]|nr:response regulator transcription factor [Actinomycetota bacterium]
MHRIFIVEDDKQIARELRILLERNGYEVALTQNFDRVPLEVQAASSDLVLLDLNLPHVDGHLICKEIRSQSEVPIIVVTSRDSTLDELVSMNFGADDFITKPYNTQILLARIASILRRTYGDKDHSALTHKGLALDTAKSRVSYGGNDAELTKNELRILHVLMQRHGEIVSRADLQNELWQSDEFVDDNTLTVNVNRLRSTLASIGLGEYIRTKRGLGYMV